MEKQKQELTPCHSMVSIMTNAELVYERLKTLPESTVAEVLDFVEFLEQRQRPYGHSGQPVSEATKGPRQPGSAQGQVWMAPDFDAPLEDFQDYQ
jgi:hypothetical protein